MPWWGWVSIAWLVITVLALVFLTIGKQSDRDLRALFAKRRTTLADARDQGPDLQDVRLATHSRIEPPT
jgi:hypothetical protein